MKITSAILAATLAASSAWAAQDREITGRVLYRYTDKNGVKVMNDVIPPDYVDNGYEILNLSGRVLKVVPPQLSGEALKEQQRRKEQEELDRKLLSRYGSETDIESARKRKLAVIQQDIAIMRSNIANLRKQIEGSEANAARIQRNGKEPGPDLLTQLGNLRAQVKVISERLDRRTKEAEEINREFDQEAKRYREISRG